MIAEAVTLPPVTREFADGLYRLAMEIGWKNAARRVAFGPTVEVVSPNGNGHKAEEAQDIGPSIAEPAIAVVSRPLNVPNKAVKANVEISDACFTACAAHVEYERLTDYRGARNVQFWLSECGDCRELTRQAMAQYAERQADKAHVRDIYPPWWYQSRERCYHEDRPYQSARGACPECWGERLETWTSAPTAFPVALVGDAAASALEMNAAGGIRPFRWEDIYRRVN